MRIVPHSACQDNLDFLTSGEPGYFVVVGYFGVEADVFEVLGNDFWLKFAKAETLSRSLVVVEFLDQFVEPQFEQSLTRYLGIVLWEHTDPFAFFVYQPLPGIGME